MVHDVNTITCNSMPAYNTFFMNLTSIDNK